MIESTQVLVNLAEIQVLKGNGVFTCLGLGSCIGVCVQDAEAQVAGVAHIMLPEAFNEDVDRPGKFADTGLRQLIEMMERMGAERSRMQAAIVGGASVFRTDSPISYRLEIGARNARAVMNQLKELGITCIAQDLGGNFGRTVTLESHTGTVTVRTLTEGEKTLCNLRG